MASNERDPLTHGTPRLAVFPPVLPAVALLAATFLHWEWPLRAAATIPWLVRLTLALALAIPGLSLFVGGILELRRHRTAIRPTESTTALVTTGAFSWSRNPMYVGGSLLLLAVAAIVPLEWLPLTWLSTLPALHMGIVRREEHYLEARFGDEFRRYAARVARYLGAPRRELSLTP